MSVRGPRKPGTAVRHWGAAARDTEKNTARNSPRNTGRNMGSDLETDLETDMGAAGPGYNRDQSPDRGCDQA
ncbi:hypothetical protein Mame01_24010 [Microbispora amethystogenes]|nr:hypothetical protein Mame01_24010 [Microbispora amethystogenes]